LLRNAQKEQENASVSSIDKCKTMQQHVHFSCQIMQICKTDTPRNCSDLTSAKKSVRKDLRSSGLLLAFVSIRAAKRRQQMSFLSSEQALV
jgi:hypothetical protein